MRISAESNVRSVSRALRTCLLAGLFLSAAFCFSNPVQVCAGGPENVLVVVNSNSPDSIAVANHFIHLRNIPPQNVVYLDRVPNPDAISCTLRQFKENILSPVLQQVSERKLDNQIDYIVYSAGFPTAVKIREHVDDLKSKVKNIPGRMLRPVASINAMTYFYQDVMQNNPGYLSMDSNWYCRRLVKNFLKSAFVGEAQTKFSNAIKLFESGKFAEAEGVLRIVVAENPGQVASRYYLARTLARQGKTDGAIEQLQACIDAGWNYGGVIAAEVDFADLREDERFVAIAKSGGKAIFGQLPTRSFSSQSVWAINGWVNRQPNQGKRFVLSTVLAVTTGRGNTLPEAITQLQRSARADSTRPTGTFFYSKTKDVRSKTRIPQFLLAVKELKDLGFGAEIISSHRPDSNRKDILGATMGRAKLNWKTEKHVFLEGAIADNLTSYGGRMEVKSGQVPCTYFLKLGAAGSSGTVVEPLAIPNKFPDARLHVHYARGCTLAEAYYQSVKSPFQLLIVGDPVCKPWASNLEFDVDGIEEGQTLTDSFKLNLKGTDEKDRIKYFDMFVDGKLAARILPEKVTNVQLDNVPDGYHELRLVAVADHLIRTKTSRRFGFHVDRNGDSVKLQISGNGKYQMSRSLPMTVEATTGDAVEIYQNSRKVATIEGRSGSISIDCSDLGEGPTKLQAFVMSGQKRIASPPVEIKILAK